MIKPTGSTVKVTTQFESFNHVFTLGHMGKNTKLQLPIITHHQGISLFCSEGLSDVVNILFQSRLVLQVGRSRRKATCFCIEIQRTVNTLLAVRYGLQRNDKGI